MGSLPAQANTLDERIESLCERQAEHYNLEMQILSGQDSREIHRAEDLYKSTWFEELALLLIDTGNDQTRRDVGLPCRKRAARAPGR